MEGREGIYYRDRTSKRKNTSCDLLCLLFINPPLSMHGTDIESEPPSLSVSKSSVSSQIKCITTIAVYEVLMNSFDIYLVLPRSEKLFQAFVTVVMPIWWCEWTSK
jgi:hypothetical protein